MRDNVASEHRVHSRLVPRSLRLEELEDIGIDTKRNRCFSLRRDPLRRCHHFVCELRRHVRIGSDLAPNVGRSHAVDASPIRPLRPTRLRTRLSHRPFRCTASFPGHSPSSLKSNATRRRRAWYTRTRPRAHSAGRGHTIAPRDNPYAGRASETSARRRLALHPRKRFHAPECCARFWPRPTRSTCSIYRCIYTAASLGRDTRIFSTRWERADQSSACEIKTPMLKRLVGISPWGAAIRGHRRQYARMEARYFQNASTSPAIARAEGSHTD